MQRGLPWKLLLGSMTSSSWGSSSKGSSGIASPIHAWCLMSKLHKVHAHAMILSWLCFSDTRVCVQLYTSGMLTDNYRIVWSGCRTVRWLLGLSGRLALWDHRTLQTRVGPSGTKYVLSGTSLCKTWSYQKVSSNVVDHPSDQVCRVLRAAKCPGSIGYSVWVTNHPVWTGCSRVFSLYISGHSRISMDPPLYQNYDLSSLDTPLPLVYNSLDTPV